MTCFFQVLKLAVLFVFVGAVAGCATTREGADDLPTDATPSTADSHGWGENIENASGK